MFVTLTSLWNYFSLLSFWPLASLLWLESKPHGCRDSVCLVHCIPAPRTRPDTLSTQDTFSCMKEFRKEAWRSTVVAPSLVFGGPCLKVTAPGTGVKTSLAFAENRGGSGEGCFHTLTGPWALLAPSWALELDFLLRSLAEEWSSPSGRSRDVRPCCRAARMLL